MPKSSSSLQCYINCGYYKYIYSCRYDNIPSYNFHAHVWHKDSEWSSFKVCKKKKSSEKERRGKGRELTSTGNLDCIQVAIDVISLILVGNENRFGDENVRTSEFRVQSRLRVLAVAICIIASYCQDVLPLKPNNLWLYHLKCFSL